MRATPSAAASSASSTTASSTSSSSSSSAMKSAVPKATPGAPSNPSLALNVSSSSSSGASASTGGKAVLAFPEATVLPTAPRPFCYLFGLFVAVQLLSVLCGFALLGETQRDATLMAEEIEAVTGFRQQFYDPEAAQALAAQQASQAALAAAQGPSVEAPLAPASPGAPPTQTQQAGAPTLPTGPGMTSASMDTLAAYLLKKLKFASGEVKRLVLQTRENPPAEAPSPVATGPSDASALLPSECRSADNLKVATFNLWNVNPPWPQRKQRIAQLLDAMRVDLVAFQEVRFTDGVNQLEQLVKEMLSRYEFVYQKIKDETVGGEQGIGLLSRYPFEQQAQFFDLVGRPDAAPNSLDVKHPRKVMHVVVKHPVMGKVNVFVTHLAKSDMQQCYSVLQLLRQVNSAAFDASLPAVLLGDMNTHFDFEWPMDYLTQAAPLFDTHPLNPCSVYFRQSPFDRRFAPFRDAWEVVYPDRPGHTFSNFQDSNIRDSSRADRILARHQPDPNDPSKSNLVECGVATFGGGESAFNHNGHPAFLSDHRGVVASYKWDTRNLPYAQKLAPRREDAVVPQVPQVPVAQPQALPQQAPPQQAPPQQAPPQQAPPQQAPPQQAPPQQPQQGALPVVKPGLVTPAATDPTPAASNDEPEVDPNQMLFDQLPPEPGAAPRSPAALAPPGSYASLAVAITSDLPLDTPDTPDPRQENNLARPAIIASSLGHYRHATDHNYHGIEKCFDGDASTFFWSERGLNTKDHITLILQQPARPQGIQVLTGQQPIAGRENEPLGDRLEEGFLEVAFVQADANGRAAITEFVPITKFVGGLANIDLTPYYPDDTSMLLVIRIRVAREQEAWLVCREIVLIE